MRTFKIHPSQCHKIMGRAKSGDGLSVTAQTYLREWYANDNEEIYSKYLFKGNMVENDLIDFAMSQLGLGIADKNTEQRENEYMIGTPDVVLDELVLDVKAGITAFDLQMLEILRDRNHPFLIAVNKVDKLSQKELTVQLQEITKAAGEGKIILCSAEERGGSNALSQALFA